MHCIFGCLPVWAIRERMSNSDLCLFYVLISSFLKINRDYLFENDVLLLVKTKKLVELSLKRSIDCRHVKNGNADGNLNVSDLELKIFCVAMQLIKRYENLFYTCDNK